MALASFNYLDPYMGELGAGESLMGFALTLGTIAEIPVLFFGHHLIRRFRPYGVLVLAMVVTSVRLLLFAANASPGLVLVIQLLNGFAFPLMWVAGVSYAHEMAPEGTTTTAQGLFSAATYGFGMAAGGFLGGPLLEAIGGRGLYLVFGVVVLAILAALVLTQRVVDRRSATTG
jgi:predicted MFS family arabinose efflux permease